MASQRSNYEQARRLVLDVFDSSAAQTYALLAIADAIRETKLETQVELDIDPVVLAKAVRAGEAQLDRR